MEVVIISKSKYEEMVGKLNRLSDRVNEILCKREGKRLSRWMDNQEVCQQLRWRTGVRMQPIVAVASNQTTQCTTTKSTVNYERLDSCRP